jgi:hypothetical protein
VATLCNGLPTLFQLRPSASQALADFLKAHLLNIFWHGASFPTAA